MARRKKATKVRQAQRDPHLKPKIHIREMSFYDLPNLPVFREALADVELTKEELTCDRCKVEYQNEKEFLLHLGTVHGETLKDMLSLRAFREKLEDDN
jgi:hypothetical protein